MARETGLEPAASAVTGRRSNQLSYSRKPKKRRAPFNERPRSHVWRYVNPAGSSRRLIIASKETGDIAAPRPSRRAHQDANQKFGEDLVALHQMGSLGHIEGR